MSDLGLQIASIATPVVAGIFGALINRSVRQIDNRLDAQDARIARQEDRIRELEENTVTKEEWLREAGATRQRLDSIAEGIARLEGKHDQATELTHVLATALGRRD